MLEWYIGVQKDKPTTFSWKQSYHLQCADALNERFGNGVTRNQSIGISRPARRDGVGQLVLGPRVAMVLMQQHTNSLLIYRRKILKSLV